jgi:hypothetical protein
MHLHLPNNDDVDVAAVDSGKRHWRCSCNCCNYWSKEYVTVTVGRWKASLLQGHENITAALVAMLYCNYCNCNYYSF